ncbi:MAG: DEAD/DEAH box helicase [FCB group bacterium]|nr:DEAD/DEAH box helicase [FCB group bacterium]
MIERKTENYRSGLEQLLGDASLAGNITSHYTEKAKSAGYVKLPADLHPALVSTLGKMGIKTLYRHQREALTHIGAGCNTLISTGVASGKSLCYQLPLLNQFLEFPDSRALLLFPTKALAQDQRESLENLLVGLPGEVRGGIGVYDGDLPTGRRAAVRNNAAFVFSNPDMLHLGILPHHTQWADFFRHLKFVVVDEVHIYRGIFGSHFANVLRRLKRIARFYGSDPLFVTTSATLSGGAGFVKKLFETNFVLVSDDAASHGEKHFLIYNPPLVNRELGIRRPAWEETLRLASRLYAAGGQTLIFAHTRKAVELLVSRLQSRLGSKEEIVGYRSGYLAGERREIEQKLRSGAIRIVVATNALELGIDIGGMDTVIINGYPGSITSTRQQSGRAGRKGAPAMTLFVASADLMDQYLVKHPDYLNRRNPESALINPDNPYILYNHLQCAAFEKAFDRNEDFGTLPAAAVADYFELLENVGKVHRSSAQIHWSAADYPAGEVSLRTATADQFILQTEDSVIGAVDRESAFWFTHPGAIYLHNGDPFLVVELNLAENRVFLIPTELTYITQAASESAFELREIFQQTDFAGGTNSFGELRVETKVTGFRKLKWPGLELLGREDLDLPPADLITHGCWFTLSAELVAQQKSAELWRNDPNEYGPDWPRLAAGIRRRDAHTCTNCRRTENGQVFHVHHKIPFRAFSSPQQANRPENLTTLCPACHRLAERQVYLQSGLGGLSYLLGRLAPLLLMCSGSDLRVLGDPQCPLAEDRPAVVFYDSAAGGIGLSEKLYSILGGLLSRGREIVAVCGCKSGCPACVGPVAVNGEGAKVQVLQMLDYLTAERAREGSVG